MLTTALLTVLFAQVEPSEIIKYEVPDAIYQAERSCRSLALSPNGKLLATGVRGDVVVWDTATKKEIARIQHGRASVIALAFSPKGRLLASASGVVKLTDSETWKLENTLKYHGSVYSIAFSPNGAALVSGGAHGDGDVVLWDVAKGIRQMGIRPTDTVVYGVAFAPSGKQFAACWQNKFKLWDYETCKEMREFSGHEKTITALAFSPDGSKLASMSDTPKLWDVASGKEIPLPTKVRKCLRQCAAWSPDGKRLALGHSGFVQIIDFDKPTRLIEIYTSSRTCRGGSDAICFSPDGKYLYAAGIQGRLVTRWKLDAPPDSRQGKD